MKINLTSTTLAMIGSISIILSAVAQNAPPGGGELPNRERAAQSPEAQAPAQAAATGAPEQGLRLNFRGVPLDMVLNYLSEAAGFIIVLETEVKGKVDVWSNQPLTKDEAVDLLNTVLNRNGYAAIRNGRTLRIVSRDEAKTKDLPVKSGRDPEEIPKSDQMVTQVIPVRYANATQLTRDLQPLLPTYATLTANESGNALVLTDTQANIRRMVEIVSALDTSISTVSSIRVFPLKYADAKELATAVKELFQAPAQGNSDRRSQFFNRIFGEGGPPGFGDRGGDRGGGNNGRGSSSSSSGGAPNARVVAIADERTNSLVVSAPDDHIPTIEKLIKEIDVSATDVTELRVFRLNNADPVELAEIFQELFPDETQTEQNRGEVRFRGPPGFPFGGGSRTQQDSSSDRMKRKGRVMAVADARTSSLIVSAASELMPQIEQMVAQLDSSSSKKQRVYIYSLENADVTQVEQVVRDIFERNNTQANRNNNNRNSALENRSQQNQNNLGNQRNTGFGNNSGLGGGNATFR